MSIKDGLRWVKRRTIRLAQRIAEVAALRFRAAWHLRYEAREPVAGAGEERLPHALILRYKYYGPDPRLGEGTEAFILDNTLAAARRASFEGFYWDADYTGFPHGDWHLLERARAARPDVLLLSSYEADNPKQPRLETLRLMRRYWNIPIVAFWWDTCWDGFWPSIQPLLPIVDLHVVGENPRMTMFDGREVGPVRKRFISLWTCLDPAFSTNPGQARDIEVSFLGQVDGYRSERTPFIEHLRAERVPLYTSLETRDRQMSHAAYVDVLQRSKIGLNFSHSVHGHQLKGRVFETLRAGALLLETDNPQTPCCFTPMQDYVPFSTPGDLVEKIRYYLAHEAERRAIAERGERKAHDLYNHDIYWARIFDALREARTWPL